MYLNADDSFYIIEFIHEMFDSFQNVLSLISMGTMVDVIIWLGATVL